jgi:polar amino acid transport system substrate-binding protein
MLLLGVGPSAVAADSLILTTSYSEPYSTPEQTGILELILTEAFLRAGHQVTFARLPAERGLREAELGLADGVVARIAGLEQLYPDLMMVPVPIIESRDFVAFTLSERPVIEKWSDLSHHNVVFVRGWKIIEQSIPTARSVVSVSSTELAFQMLKRGRADVVVSPRLDGLVMSHKLGLSPVFVHQPPLESMSLYPYLSRKHSDIVPEIEAALLSMKEDGTFYDIYASAMADYAVRQNGR